MVFLTNRYIYTEDEKLENKIEIEAIEFKNYLDDEFKIGVKEKIKDKYDEIIEYDSFYDYFKILGNVAFFDEDVLIVNDKVIFHNFLKPSRKKELFDDISDIENFLKKHIDESFTLISDEDISLKKISVKEALKRVKLYEINEIFIKVNGEFIKKNLPFSILAHYIDEISLKFKKEKKIKTHLKGAGFLEVYRKNENIILKAGKNFFEVKIEELL